MTDIMEGWQDYRVTFTIEAQFSAENHDDARAFAKDLQGALLSGYVSDDEWSRRGCDVADVCEISRVTKVRRIVRKVA